MMQEIKEEDVANPRTSSTNSIAGTSTPDPYQDDEAHASSGAVDSQRLLGHESPVGATSNRRFPAWGRLFRHFNPLRVRNGNRRRARSTANEECFCEKSTAKRKASRRCLRFGLGILVVLGIIQLLTLLLHLPHPIPPSPLSRILHSWGQPGQTGANLTHYPTDFSRDIPPIPCHSHNDYWRLVPLYSAIGAGCIGVEADVWLYEEELYVGHDVASLTPNRTLGSLYVEPLVGILEGMNPVLEVFGRNGSNSGSGSETGNGKKNGIFDTTPTQTLILLIDFKTEGNALWPYVSRALDPLRERGYLTYRNGSTNIEGPVTVVGTGNTPFSLVTSDTANPHHDIFFDAPLQEMSSPSPPSPSPSPDTNKQHKYNSTSSIYASTSLSHSIGTLLPTGKFSKTQLSTLRAQIRGAHDRGLKVRYWDTPHWPLGLRNYVWGVLVREGVDLLNVDDLKGVGAWDWGRDGDGGWWWWRREGR